MKRVLIKAAKNRNEFKLARVKESRNIYVIPLRLSPAGPPSDRKWVLGSIQGGRRSPSWPSRGLHTASPPLSVLILCILFRDAQHLWLGTHGSKASRSPRGDPS